MLISFKRFISIIYVMMLMMATHGKTALALLFMLLSLSIPVRGARNLTLVKAQPYQNTYNYTDVKLYDDVTKFYFGPYYLMFDRIILPGDVHKGNSIKLYDRETGNLKYNWVGEDVVVPGFNATYYEGFGPSAKKIFSFLFKSAQEDPEGNYYAIIDIYDCIYEVKYEIQVTADPPMANVPFSGGTVNVKLNLTNTGTVDIEELTYMLILPTTGEVSVGPGSDVIYGHRTGLAVNETITLNFVLDVEGSTEYKIIPIPFDVAYSDLLEPTTGISHATYVIQITVGTRATARGIPRLTFNMVTTKSTLKPGDTAQITVNPLNVGNGSAYNVEIYINTTPADLTLTFQNPSAFGTVVGGISKPIRFVWPNGSTAPLRPGQSLAEPIKFIVKVPEYSIVGEKKYRVTVTGYYFDALGNSYTSTSSIELTVVEPGKAILTITKTVSASWVGVGGTVRVTIIVTNEGNGVARNVKIEDEYPSSYFNLKTGSITQNVPQLGPGESINLVYELTAVKVGTVSLGSGRVEYTDEYNVQHMEYSNEGGLVSIVTPQVKVRVLAAPNQTIPVGEYTKYVIEVKNEGNGPAVDVKLSFKVPKGLDILSLKPDDVQLSGQRVASLYIQSMSPGEFQRIELEFKPIIPGIFNITPIEMSYLSPDGSVKLSIEGNITASFTAVVPYTVRMILLSTLIIMIVLVGLLVVALTVGLPVISKPSARRRLGF